MDLSTNVHRGHRGVGCEAAYTRLNEMNLVEVLNVKKAYTCAKV